MSNDDTTALAPSDPEKVKLLTPEDIARISEQALASCRKSAADVRALGYACQTMGEQVNIGCEQLAADFEEHGNGAANAALAFAEKAYTTSRRVEEIRQEIAPTNAAHRNHH